MSIGDLPKVIQILAPHVDPDVWVQALWTPMQAAEINNAKRMSAFLANCAVESSNFQSLSENLDYSSAQRISTVFKIIVDPTLVHNPEGLGNLVYRNRLGNGDEESGDGFRFRGGGLIDLTGRDAYAACGAAQTSWMTPEATADWVRTPPGAAASAVWWWMQRIHSYGMNHLADAWELSAITRMVNGPAMLGNQQRIAYANDALAILQ